MPYSLPYHMAAIASRIYERQPKTLLDLGCGTGIWGAIARQYLDFIHGRFARQDWRALITGIEIFGAYETPMWRMYDEVRLTNFTDIGAAGCDMVLMVDSLEHMEPEAGRLLLERLIGEAREIIVSVPIGKMEQGAVHGNEHERHRTTFAGTEFARHGATEMHRGICLVVSIPGRLK